MAKWSYSETFGGTGWSSFGEYLQKKGNRINDHFKEEYRSEDGKPESLIFKDCVVWVDGRTRVPDARLKMLMIRHGGEYEAYNLSRVTHIIADNLAIGNQRWRKIRDRGRSKFFVVTSEWVIASVKRGSRIPESLFIPESLKTTTSSFGSMFRFFTPSNILSDSNVALPCGQQETCLDTSALNSDVSPTLDKEKSVNLSVPFEKLSRPLALCTDYEENFVRSFFSASRLHFIGRWRQRISSKFTFSTFAPILPELASADYVDQRHHVTLQQYFSNKIFSKNVPMPSLPHKKHCCEFLHVDFDAFFVSVALQKYPEFQSKAVAVCHGSSTNSGSEIASCNYIARKYGIQKGMWLREAKSLCSDLCVLPYDFEAIEHSSLAMVDILTDVTSRVLPVSCDEAYVQLVGQYEVDRCESIAEWIRNKIFTVTGCYTSIGIGPNLLLSKLATSKAKPNNSHPNSSCGIYRVRPPYKDFMGSIPLADLPGIGQRALEKLQPLNLLTCADVLAQTNVKGLQDLLGEKQGTTCYSFCMGCDPRPFPRLDSLVETNVDPDRCLTVSINWGIRLTVDAGVRNLLSQIAEECELRLSQGSLTTSDICLKILRRAAHAPIEPAKYGGCGECDEFTQKITLCPKTVSEGCEIFPHLYQLWNMISTREICPIPDIRGVSVMMSKLRKKERLRTVEFRNSVQSCFESNDQDVPDRLSREASDEKRCRTCKDSFDTQEVDLAHEAPLSTMNIILEDPASEFSDTSVEICQADTFRNDLKTLSDPPMEKACEFSGASCGPRVPSTGTRCCSLEAQPSFFLASFQLKHPDKAFSTTKCNQNNTLTAFDQEQGSYGGKLLIPRYQREGALRIKMPGQKQLNNSMNKRSRPINQLSREVVKKVAKSCTQPTLFDVIRNKPLIHNDANDASKPNEHKSVPYSSHFEFNQGEMVEIVDLDENELDAITEQCEIKTAPYKTSETRLSKNTLASGIMNTVCSSSFDSNESSNLSLSLKSPYKKFSRQPVACHFQSSYLISQSIQACRDLENYPDNHLVSFEASSFRPHIVEKISSKTPFFSVLDSTPKWKLKNPRNISSDSSTTLDNIWVGSRENFSISESLKQHPQTTNQAKSMSFAGNECKTCQDEIKFSMEDHEKNSVSRAVMNDRPDEAVPYSLVSHIPQEIITEPSDSNQASPCNITSKWDDELLGEIIIKKKQVESVKSNFVDLCIDLTDDSNESEADSIYSQVELTYCPNLVAINLLPPPTYDGDFAEQIIQRTAEGSSDISGILSTLVKTDQIYLDNNALLNGSFNSAIAYKSRCAMVTEKKQEKQKAHDATLPAPLSRYVLLNLGSSEKRTLFSSEGPKTTLSSPPITDSVYKDVTVPPNLDVFCDPSDIMTRLLSTRDVAEHRARMFNASLEFDSSDGRYCHEVCGGANEGFSFLKNLCHFFTAPFDTYTLWFSQACWMCVASNLVSAYVKYSSFVRKIFFTHLGTTLFMLSWLVVTINREAEQHFFPNLERLPAVLLFEEVWGISTCLSLHRDLDIRNEFLSEFLYLLQNPSTLVTCAASMLSTEINEIQHPSKAIVQRVWDLLKYLDHRPSENLQCYALFASLSNLTYALQQVLKYDTSLHGVKPYDNVIY